MIAVVGYGNSLRRDDGAGLVLAGMVANGLEAAGLDVCRIEMHQLTPELALDICDPDIEAAIFADARLCDGGAEVRFERLNGAVSDAGMGHHFSPESVMALVRGLFGREMPAWVVSAPGWDFAHGEGLSARAEAALHRAQMAVWIKDVRVKIAKGEK